MKNLAKIALPLAAIAALSAPAAAQADEPRGLSKGEAELAELLDGRVVGQPQDCVRLRHAQDFKIIDGTALVIEKGDTIYVNYTRDPESLDDRDVIVTRTSGTGLCRLDPVTTYERSHGFYTGNIFLSDFLPYRKPN